MARAREKDKAKQPSLEDGLSELGKKQELGSGTEPEAETPWYQFTDWWADDPDHLALARIDELASSNDNFFFGWAVLPAWMIRRFVQLALQLESLETEKEEQLGEQGTETKLLARELLLEMLRAQGKWSPRYVEDAWTGAEAFVARSKGKSSSLEKNRMDKPENRSPNCPLVTGLRPCMCDLPRCPKCNYTEHDARFEMDHDHCDGTIPDRKGDES